MSCEKEKCKWNLNFIFPCHRKTVGIAAQSMNVENPRAELSLKGMLALASAVKGLWHTEIFPLHWLGGYAMLISPSKGKTAVHGCHCPGDMAVRMREVLARPWVGAKIDLVSCKHPGDVKSGKSPNQRSHSSLLFFLRSGFCPRFLRLRRSPLTRALCDLLTPLHVT